MSRHPALRLVLLLGLLFSVTLGLQQLALYGHQHLARPGLNLTPHLQVYRDASAREEIAAVVRRFGQGRFRTLLPDELSFGYTRDALWITVALSNPGPDPVIRYLEVGPPRLADIRLYEADGEGRFRERRAGLQVEVQDREIKNRQSVFPVTIAPGSQHRLFVRITSNNAIIADLRLWEPAAFAEVSRKVDLVNGMQFGALLMFALYVFVAAAVMRDPTHVFFGITLLAHAFYDITIFQYGYQYLWPHSPDWSLRGAGVLIAFTTFGLGLLVSGVLEARQRLPGWHVALGGVSWLALALVPGMLYGDYSAWVQWLNFVALLQLALTISVTLQAVFRGQRGARLLLGAFLLLWFTSLLRVGQVLGQLPGDILAEYSQGWSLLLGGLLMALIQADRVRRLNAEREESRHALLRAQVDAREEAEQAVVAHTQELVRAKEAAEASSRAKSAFLTQLSHELRTPLHSILGYSGLMRDETGDAESQRRLDAIRRSGLHLLQLIDGLLDYARGEAGRLQLELQPLRLRDFLESVLDETRELAAQQKMILDLTVAPGLPPGLRLDGTRLRQVLINLVANACRHSQARHIGVEVRPEPAHRPGMVRLSLAIRDDGIGIRPADRDRIFQPFEQGQEGNSKGLGLGLAISRQLVALMGGELVLEESAGGSCFRLTLEAEPIDLPAAALPGPGPASRRYAGARRRALVVDDHADSRELLVQRLQALGFEVAVAAEAGAALGRLGEGGIHLVFTDRQLPGMSGAELLDEARRRGHRQPFVLVSAAAHGDAGEAETFAGILARPVAQEALAACAGRLLGLAWTDQPAPSSKAAPEVHPRPPAPLLEELRRAAREGRLSDIEDWVEQVELQYPGMTAFTRAVRAAARRLDLVAIASMAGDS